ncbi:MAG: fibronectin type III domain-containing protein, partial [Candidatus Limnocylindrales bacterium]
TNALGDGPASASSASVTPAAVPDPPTAVSAVAGNAQAQVSWSAPATNGGSPISAYTVTSSPGARTCTSATLGCTVTGLTNGTSYTFTVVATNALGDGPASASSASVTPTPDMTAPTVEPPTATLLADQAMNALGQIQLHISWPAATDDSGVVVYELQQRVNNKAWKQVPLASPTALARDQALRPGKSYTFRIRARDGAGNWSAWVESAKSPLVQFQERAAALTYHGAFRRVHVAGASAGYVKRTLAAGASVQLEFSGSSVAFMSTLGRFGGIAEVWLDGTMVAALDLYAPTRRAAQVVWSAAVGPGNHVLVIRATGTKNASAIKTRVETDAFLVFG